jgi:hypothetical protein
MTPTTPPTWHIDKANGTDTFTLYPCACGQTLTLHPGDTLDCCNPECLYCNTTGHTWRNCPQKADDEGDQLRDQEPR